MAKEVADFSLRPLTIPPARLPSLTGRLLVLTQFPHFKAIKIDRQLQLPNPCAVANPHQVARRGTPPYVYTPTHTVYQQVPYHIGDLHCKLQTTVSCCANQQCTSNAFGLFSTANIIVTNLPLNI